MLNNLSVQKIAYKGFTLIELTIVVGIIGILTTVALPSYQAYMQDGRRTDVQHFVLQQVAILERQYTREGGYRDSGNKSTEFMIEATDNYVFSYKPTASGMQNDQFTIAITPKASSAQKMDRCGVMTINHQGITTGAFDDCWR